MSVFWWDNGIVRWAHAQTGEITGVLDRVADEMNAREWDEALAFRERQLAGTPAEWDPWEAVDRREGRGIPRRGRACPCC